MFSYSLAASAITWMVFYKYDIIAVVVVLQLTILVLLAMRISERKAEDKYKKDLARAILKGRATNRMLDRSDERLF